MKTRYPIVLAVVALLALRIAVDAQNRYDMELTPEAKEAFKNVYIENIDPNDPIYNLLWKPTPEWTKTFGNSERSRILSNLSGLNRVVVELVKMNNAQAERIVALEKEVIVDPNANGIYGRKPLMPLNCRVAALEESVGIEYVIGDPNAVDPNGVEE